MSTYRTENDALRVYQFVRAFILREHYPPSFREIADGTGINSTSHISDLLTRLHQRGLIGRVAGKSRTISLPELWK